MSFSNFLEAKLLDHVFGASAYSVPATLYVGLSVGDPGEAGSLAGEPAFANGYARKAVVNNLTNFPAAAGGVKMNGTDIAFPTSTGAWAGGVPITHFFITDDPTAGNLLGSGALLTAREVDFADIILEFAAGSLIVTLD